MALTKVQVLEVFVRIAEPELIRQRMTQMYGVLTSGQQNSIFDLVKADVLSVLNSSKLRLETQDSNIDAALTAANDEIDDINNAT